MALVRFDQDPELQPGAGVFHADDGTSFPAFDPEMAAQLSQPQPDERLALAGFPDTEARLAAGGQEAPGVAPPVASDAGGSWKLDDSRMGKAPEQNATVQAALRPEAGPPPQQAPLGQANREQADAEQLQGNVDRYVPEYKRVAPRRGGVQPTTQQETREASGVPYDPNGPEAQARAEASINVNMAGANKANAESARAAGEAAAYQAALPQLQEQARVAQMRRDMQERQYRRDRDDLERAIEESNKSSKSFDANRWFSDRGAIGMIGAGIAQAFGAGAAALTGGPNVVLQQINGYIDRDIANQRQQIDAGKENANSALARLNRQYGNLDQAEAALRIAQQKKVETMASSYAASTKSEDIQKALDVWLADNEQKRVKDEQAFQNASYGKTSVTTAAKVIPSSSGGIVPLTEKEKQDYYQTLNKRNEVIGGTYENESKRRKALGIDPEKQAKDEERLIEDLKGNSVVAKSKEEATKIRDMKSLHTNASGSIQALGKLAKSGSSLSPDDVRSFDMNLEQVVNGINTMAGQGVVRGEDMARIKASLQNRVGSMPAEKAVAELQTLADRAYQARVDAQRGSAVKVAETGAGQQVKYTGNSAKTPTAAGQFRQVGR